MKNFLTEKRITQPQCFLESFHFDRQQLHLESPEVEFQLHRCEAYQASYRGRNQQSFELELSWKFVKGRTSPPLKNTTFSGLCPFTVPVVLVAQGIIKLRRVDVVDYLMLGDAKKHQHLQHYQNKHLHRLHHSFYERDQIAL